MKFVPICLEGLDVRLKKKGKARPSKRATTVREGVVEL